MKTLPMIDSHVDSATCSACGGACCKNMPGSSMPSDFGAPDVAVMRARIRSALASGRWAVDWWEEDGAEPKMLYLRPAIRGFEGRVYHPAEGHYNACTFLRADGCSIFPARPMGCRGLRPRVDREWHGCDDVHSGKLACARAWFPYFDLVEDIADEVDALRVEPETDAVATMFFGLMSSLTAESVYPGYEPAAAQLTALEHDE